MTPLGPVTPTGAVRRQPCGTPEWSARANLPKDYQDRGSGYRVSDSKNRKMVTFTKCTEDRSYVKQKFYWNKNLQSLGPNNEMFLVKQYIFDIYKHFPLCHPFDKPRAILTSSLHRNYPNGRPPNTR